MAKRTVLDSRSKAKGLLEIALEKKPLDPLILDLRHLNFVWDYFVILTSFSQLHTQAVIEELVYRSKKEHIDIHHVEKDYEGGWTLIDYFDVLIHIFSEEKRKFYALDRLFKKAKKVRFRFKK